MKPWHAVTLRACHSPYSRPLPDRLSPPDGDTWPHAGSFTDALRAHRQGRARPAVDTALLPMLQKRPLEKSQARAAADERLLTTTISTRHSVMAVSIVLIAAMVGSISSRKVTNMRRVSV